MIKGGWDCGPTNCFCSTYFSNDDFENKVTFKLWFANYLLINNGAISSVYLEPLTRVWHPKFNSPPGCVKTFSVEPRCKVIKFIKLLLCTWRWLHLGDRLILLVSGWCRPILCHVITNMTSGGGYAICLSLRRGLVWISTNIANRRFCRYTTPAYVKLIYDLSHFNVRNLRKIELHEVPIIRCIRFDSQTTAEIINSKWQEVKEVFGLSEGKLV